MFTLAQIAAAHGKVKSGADFPQYIRDIKALGVVCYVSWVCDGHTEYRGADGHAEVAAQKYAALEVAPAADVDGFMQELRKHQGGGSTYAEFCALCARAGVERWEVSLPEMVCTYYSRAGEALYAEAIPE